jgi:PAS domain S-box-containing protein
MSSREKVNILMVDDQSAKLLSYEAILEELNENLIKASSAKEALDHLLRSDVGVVLMDVSMPDMDGFELADMIRQHPRFQNTAIIFISAVHLTTLDRLHGYARGAVDYISVPFDPELLRAKVAVFSELHRRTCQLETLNRELEQRVSERTSELEIRTISLKALNEELLLRNQQLDAIVATAPDIIFSSERGGDRDYISDRFYEYTGAAPGSAIGHGWLAYVHPEDVVEIQRQWRHCVENGNRYESEYRLRGRSGEYRWFRARAIPVRDSAGSIAKWCGTCADIHDQRLLETSFRENAAYLEKTVQERTDALRRLSGRLMTLQEEERRRIARELHDSVGQELAAAKMNLDRVLLADDEQSPITVEAVESLQRAIQQVRTISHLLYPPLLDEVGLTSAVRWYLEGLTARSGIQISFQFTPKAFPRLTRELETAAFRIIQEAMTNLYRHSEATEGTVSLEYLDQSILVRILDNGTGLGREILQMEASALGVGLGGMKQRVEELGGTLRLSDAQPGTIVEADIPLAVTDPARRAADRPEVTC